jgi:signal transduction histidine kinase
MGGLRLKQVLLNYLSNAIKFSHPNGQVVVKASMPEPGRLRVEVQDDGIGMSEADQAQLFVRFRQLSTGVTKAYEGTGIGLALVKQIVEAQGGRVGVRSEPGKGSVFWAEWPACP